MQVFEFGINFFYGLYSESSLSLLHQLIFSNLFHQWINSNIYLTSHTQASTQSKSSHLLPSFFVSTLISFIRSFSLWIWMRAYRRTDNIENVLCILVRYANSLFVASFQNFYNFSHSTLCHSISILLTFNAAFSISYSPINTVKFHIKQYLFQKQPNHAGV